MTPEEKYKINNPWMSSFSSAKNRCTNKNSSAYKRYGGRGILFKLTKEEIKFIWIRDKACKLNAPSIDRIDNDRNYELSNCRFIERNENAKLGGSVGGKRIWGKSKKSKVTTFFKTKLKPEDVYIIRQRAANGEKHKAIAKDYNIRFETVSEIKRRKTWKDI